MRTKKIGFLFFFIFILSGLNSLKRLKYKKNRLFSNSNHLTKKKKNKKREKNQKKKRGQKHKHKHKKSKILHTLKRFGANFKNDLLKISWMFLKNNNMFKQTGLKSYAYKNGKNGRQKKRSLYKKYKFFRSKKINDILKYRKHFLIWG